MSWGFAEGQAVFASDEATYDSVFNVPGVTFVASTGDYGAADPEYPPSRPTWWPSAARASRSTRTTPTTARRDGAITPIPSVRSSAPAAASACTSPSRPIQQGVQSTGMPNHARRLVGRRSGHRRVDRRPVQPGSQQSVRGRGRHEPVGAGLGGPAWRWSIRAAAAGESTLEQLAARPRRSRPSTAAAERLQRRSPAATTATAAGAGYNLVTGLGTPVANLLVPDLVAYQGPARPSLGPDRRAAAGRQPGRHRDRVPAVRSTCSACSIPSRCLLTG